MLTGDAPFSGYGNSTLGQFYFSCNDGNLAWSFGASVWKSIDHASNFTAYAAPIDINGAALYQAAPWYICGSQGNFVYTSDTFETGSFVGRQGDLVAK